MTFTGKGDRRLQTWISCVCGEEIALFSGRHGSHSGAARCSRRVDLVWATVELGDPERREKILTESLRKATVVLQRTN
jgi:hypothetical protein